MPCRQSLYAVLAYRGTRHAVTANKQRLDWIRARGHSADSRSGKLDQAPARPRCWAHGPPAPYDLRRVSQHARLPAAVAEPTPVGEPQSSVVVEVFDVAASGGRARGVADKKPSSRQGRADNG